MAVGMKGSPAPQQTAPPQQPKLLVAGASQDLEEFERGFVRMLAGKLRDFVLEQDSPQGFLAVEEISYSEGLWSYQQEGLREAFAQRVKQDLVWRNPRFAGKYVFKHDFAFYEVTEGKKVVDHGFRFRLEVKKK